MKHFKFLTNRSGLMGMILLALVTAAGITSCKPDFDLDKKFPEWLGTSIYATLEEGFPKADGSGDYQFKTYLRLIKDLGQDTLLSRTGSRTLFVADDDAFARFFANCPFKQANGSPVTKYEELSYAQKTMLLKGSTLNNVYQVAMLSSSAGPTIGDCMRRLSSSSIYDTITILKPEDMPATGEWLTYKNAEKSIAIMQNGTVRPMIFFVNKFLTYKKITLDDYNFLFNRDPKGDDALTQEDATVNGVRIEYQNKKCFNGFIHVMEDVIYLLPNMAEYLAQSDKSVIWSSILERFSAPYYFTTTQATGNSKPDNDAITKEVNRLVDQQKISIPRQDAVYTKMYLSDRSYGDAEQLFFPSSRTVNHANWALKFDPGWNTYYAPLAGTASQEAIQSAVQQNMGVMIVPNDATITEWWLTGAGSSMRERYGIAKYKDTPPTNATQVAEDMDSIPREVIVKLVNVNMLSSLVASVPSKFGNVLNDANDPLFNNIQKAIDGMEEVVMCCNGAIYFSNIVYTPTAYRSVSYPVLTNEKLSIIQWAIDDKTMSFSAYLNSMVSTYSFFVPLVDTVESSPTYNRLIWVDPVSLPLKSYSNTDPSKYLTAMVFKYDESYTPPVIAEVYPYDTENNKVVTDNGPYTTVTNGDIIRDRLGDLMDYHIIIGDVEEAARSSYRDNDGYVYLRTKGRGTIRFKAPIDPKDVDMKNEAAVNAMLEQMEVSGGWQIESGDKVKIVKRYDMSKEGNGRTYIIDRPLLTSRRSVYDVLSDSVNYPEFKGFYDLMMSVDGLFLGTSNGNAIGSAQCVTSFNTYHYTMYIPTTESLKSLYTDGILCRPEYLDSIELYYKAVRQDLEDEFSGMDGAKDSVNAHWTDIMIAFHKELTGVSADVTPTHEDSVFDYSTYVAAERQKTRDLVKYHIQDNSVFVNADFFAGYDDFGDSATVAKYETAYMDDSTKQFTKLTVSGGKQVFVTDAKNNTQEVRQITSTAASHMPLYNIMCREYEYNTKSVSDYSTAASSQLETSSYVVIHLIDSPLLCNFHKTY